MATAHAKNKGTQLKHLQQKQDTRGFGTVSPIVQRVSRNTSGWEAQLQTSSPDSATTILEAQLTAGKEHLCWGDGPEVWASTAQVKSLEPGVQAKTYPCICSKAPLLGI